MASDISLSSSLLALLAVIAVIIWSLVFHFIIFKAYLTFVKAVILIFKHATFLRLLDLSSESALVQAELGYQQANIDLNIQQHLAASSQEHSVELFSSFIMATDIGWFILASVKLISHQIYGIF